MNLMQSLGEETIYRTESDAAEDHLSIRSDNRGSEFLTYFFLYFQFDWLEVGGGEKQPGSDQLCPDLRSG